MFTFRNCIIQHLMSVKLCFYCKTFISTVKKMDGTIIFETEVPEDASPDGSVLYGPENSRPEERTN